MNGLARNLARCSSYANKWIGEYWSDAIPLYFVCEYPRSGGTWLADMVSDYLQIPFPKNNVFPLGCRGLIHGHWLYTRRLKRVLYGYRDGRDAVVSMFFYCTRPKGEWADRTSIRYLAQRYPYLLDLNAGETECRMLLPRFIEDWIKRPYACRQSWVQHVEEWGFDAPNVILVSYEDLNRDTEATLSRAIAALTGESCDAERIAATVEKFSFRRQTGRAKGTVDRTSAKRRGVVGDWKNYFSKEAGEVFDHYCGDLLVRLGYEPNREWHKSLPSLDVLVSERRRSG